ncbi:malate dehydrogenase [Fuerstiella marisgermanici]|uniref:L-lactate dehydrogenase n=1 Tax=Fuerstiella marisgermanici TaxID=1891926 RepID=A0A1P8WEM1_9PLAN|nr:lactate/malate dehydrogenase family protein [Fuerstiella marisgermanici]APZ92502.1 L-lactate dehydrogenase [Fuerstiella marisgermanici]
MKVTIVGTGHVGATLAYVTVLEGLADQLVLINRDRQKAAGHALDLQHTASLVRQPIRVSSGEISDSAKSDVVVFTISVPMDPAHPDRRALAAGNAVLVREWLPALAEASPDAVFLIVTNPVDVMTWAALQVTDLPVDRVCGVGTLVDSARFRAMMSEELGIHPDDIRAYILGEHGQSQVAAISLAWVGGEPIDQSFERAREFARNTTDSGIEVFRLKGYTNFAVAKATALVIEAIQHDQRHTMPLSVLLNGYCGIDDVCLSIPVVIGRAGITRRLRPKLTPDEVAAFRASADQVRQNNQQISPILNDSLR